MSSKVILTVTRGEAKGKTYTYDGQERVLIGRQEDCAIVVPEKTVSRYHCLLEILPPRVRLQDFGSLNGTFLNGEKIGQGTEAVRAYLTQNPDIDQKITEEIKERMYKKDTD